MDGNRRERLPLPIATPRAGQQGIGWPAVPTKADGPLLALLFQFERSQWAPPDALVDMQMRQLEQVLNVAAKTVPFWRERLRPLAGAKKLTPELLRRVPLLTREDIQTHVEAMVSRKPPKGHEPIGEVVTSGSTGRPVRVKATRVTQLVFKALNMRLHLWHDRNPDGRVAALTALSGSEAKAAAEGKPIRWAPVFGRGEMWFKDIRTPVGQQLDWLGEVDPHYLLTYPTNLRALIERAAEVGWAPTRLAQVSTMGEIVTDDMRDACRARWDAELVDVYSTRESGIVAIQCPGHPHYLAQSESVYLEILDDDDQPCAPGTVGRIVVSVLNNLAMPMLRYDVGDFAEVGGPCPTGRGLPVLRRIIGRARNMLVLPSGDRIWPYLPNAELAGMVPLRQMQVVQTALDAIEIRLCVARPLTDDETARLAAIVARDNGHPFDVTVTYHDAIGRSAGGKFEDFVCAIDRPPPAPEAAAP